MDIYNALKSYFGYDEFKEGQKNLVIGALDGKDVLGITDLSFEGLRQYLEVVDSEGIVFHDKLSDKMCKIRKSDFGIKR